MSEREGLEGLEGGSGDQNQITRLLKDIHTNEGATIGMALADLNKFK